MNTTTVKKDIIKHIETTGSLKTINKNVKKFYAFIAHIKEALHKLIAIDTTSEDLRDKAKEENKYVGRLTDKIKSFANEYNLVDKFKTKYTRLIKIKNYNEILNDFLEYEQEILKKFEHISIIIPYDEKSIKDLYEESLTSLKNMYIIGHTSKDIKKTITDCKENINNFLTTVVIYLVKYNGNKSKNSDKKITSSDIHDKYIRGLYEKITDEFEKFKNNIVKKLTSLTGAILNSKSKYTVGDVKKTSKIYRKIIKALFMIMEKYYYYDLKYKYKSSYQTLNNSYQKNKKGSWKKSGRWFTKASHSISPFGKYKSKVRLGRKYKINPTFGYSKGTGRGTGKKIFSYNIKDLEKKKTELEAQINEYGRKIIDLGPNKSKTHFEYYEVKDRLVKEIRKLKKIKFFLLRKTVRLKERSTSIRPKLINTINTLKAKIISRTPKIFSNTKTDKRNSIDTALVNLNKSADIETAITEIGTLFNKIGVTKLRNKKKIKTLKRLKKLSKMVKAKEIIGKIDTKLTELSTINNINSTKIRNKIKTDKITIKKTNPNNYAGLTSQLKVINKDRIAKIKINSKKIFEKAPFIKEKKKLEDDFEAVKRDIKYLESIEPPEINELGEFTAYLNAYITLLDECLNIIKSIDVLNKVQVYVLSGTTLNKFLDNYVSLNTFIIDIKQNIEKYTIYKTINKEYIEKEIKRIKKEKIPYYIKNIGEFIDELITPS